ncbi:hypothetical protein SGRIM119S_07334 [Streptomyces griseorubiginosus]
MRKLNWMSALWCSSEPPYVTQIRPASRAALAIASVASKTMGNETMAGTLRATHVVRLLAWVSAFAPSLVVSREAPCFLAPAVESLTSVL